MKINLNFEITPEEIFSIGELIEKKIAREVLSEFRPSPAPCPVVNSQDSWVGKTVKIKSSTPDSEINSWVLKLERGVEYGVTLDHVGSIKIQRIWYPTIWFEVVS